MREDAPTRAVRGEILIPDDVEPTEAAFILVEIEDVSRADAPSIVVGEQRRERVGIRPGAHVPFEVQVPDRLINESASYSVRVHIDVAGSGEVERGDMVSTQSHPVLTRGYGNEALVRVRRV
jgi:putative lipoprotein